jgi:hypothetical protein
MTVSLLPLRICLAVEPDEISPSSLSHAGLSLNRFARSSTGGEKGSEPEEHSETFSHIGEDFNRSGCGELCAPSVPVQVLDVIGQDDASYLAVLRQSHLERISFA